MKLVMEIRAGEGGKDAELLVRDQARIYIRYAERMGVTVEVQDGRS